MTARRSCILVAFALVLGCATERPHDQPVFGDMPRGSPLNFQYVLADGKGLFTSQSLRGRPSVITFVTTYDLASQAQVRFLTGVIHHHTPRVNGAAIVLEPMENRTLVIAFRDALKLDYPVALGDETLIGGGGPFGDVRAVPTTVVLDAENRMVWKHEGLAKDEEIESALRGL